jgi:hypothetical protein
MIVIVRFENTTFPPDSLYCKLKMLFEPAVIEIVETVLAWTWIGVTAAADEITTTAVLSLAATLLVPVIA